MRSPQAQTFPQAQQLAVTHINDCEHSAVCEIEQELDRAIAELDRASVKAMANGDPTGARLYADRMMAAIRSRTAEHQARLHAAVAARIADESSFHGDWTAEVLNRAATHFNVPAAAVRRRMA